MDAINRIDVQWRSMCGICGAISKNQWQDSSFITRMQNALIHRGPDGAGTHESGNQMSLAVRRLSIIDLANGWQPLFNEDRSLALIANGEIYNFIELRSILESKGHTFRTNSDSETILHLYEEHGIDCVQHLRGMFAFALWDNPRKRLLLARDRIGEKPLYLFEREGTILFSSELKSLLASGLIPFELNPDAINLYFHYHYVPEPLTPVQNVRKLAPAHRMVIQLDPWKITEDRYWNLEDSPPSDGDPATRIKSELDSVSRIIIRSDVPVGVALSGGLDSSVIAAFISKHYPGQLQAFSVGYPGRPPFDEREEAQATADYLKIPLHQIELQTGEMVASFPELVRLRDDPIADISGFGYYSVARLARERNVPVLMQGQGGDELFWGYPWVRKAVEDSILKSSLFNGDSAIFQSLHFSLPSSISPGALRSWFTGWFGLREHWKKIQTFRSSPADQLVFYDLTPDFQSALRGVPHIYTPKFQEQSNGTVPWKPFKVPQPWQRPDLTITRLIYETYLLENGIAQGDRLSMASSVELRLPLLDYRFVETVIGLRKKSPDHFLPAKHWLKESVKGILPDWILNRPKKGFQPPVQEWYQALFQQFGNQLTDGYLVQNEILNSEAAKELSKGVCEPNDIVPLSFKALVLEMWCRKITSIP